MMWHCDWIFSKMSLTWKEQALLTLIWWYLVILKIFKQSRVIIIMLSVILSCKTQGFNFFFSFSFGVLSWLCSFSLIEESNFLVKSRVIRMNGNYFLECKSNSLFYFVIASISIIVLLSLVSCYCDGKF